MTHTTEARISRLIDLLDTLLARETASRVTDPLDHLLTQLTRIDKSMSTAAMVMRDLATQRPKPAQDLKHMEAFTASRLGEMLEEQRQMRAQIDALVDLLRMPPAGPEQTG